MDITETTQGPCELKPEKISPIGQLYMDVRDLRERMGHFRNSVSELHLKLFNEKLGDKEKTLAEERDPANKIKELIDGVQDCNNILDETRNLFNSFVNLLS